METTKDNILEEATWSPLNARFSLFAPGINKATGQRPYLKEATLYDVYRWMNSMKMKKNHGAAQRRQRRETTEGFQG